MSRMVRAAVALGLASAAALAAVVSASAQTPAAEPNVRVCWIPPADAPAVRVSFTLSPDGKLQGDPTVLKPSRDPRARAAEAAAIRAVRRCSPYKLPRANLEKGLRVTVTFDPVDLR